MIIGQIVNGGKLELDLPTLVDTRLLIQANSGGGKSWLFRLVAERAGIQTIVLDNELSKKAILRNEHTSAMARRASNAGYECAIVEKAMRRPGSLRVGAPSRVRSHSSPAGAALDRRRHYG
jgi:hypothetical protein